MNEELMKRLDLLASKLGVTAEHMWEVLTVQGTIEGFYGIVWMVLGLAGIALGAWMVSKAWPAVVATDKEYGKNCAERFTGSVMSLFLGCIVLVLGLVCVYGGFGDTRYLFNPEYFAIHKISSFLN